MKHPRGCVCSKDTKTKTQFYLPHLRTLCRKNKSDRSEYFKTADPCIIKYLSQCCDAILKEYIQLPTADYPKLRKQRNNLLLLAKRKASIAQKRATLSSKSGGAVGIIPVLLKTLLSVAAGIGGSVAGDYISRRIATNRANQINAGVQY
jgi:hypothetical protein